MPKRKGPVASSSRHTDDVIVVDDEPSSSDSIEIIEEMTFKVEDVKPSSLQFVTLQTGNQEAYLEDEGADEIYMGYQEDEQEEDEEQEHIEDQEEEFQEEENAWQTEMTDLYMLNNQLYTDVRFQVGETGETVKCHKVSLAKVSSVFRDMFNKAKSNSKDENNCIIIPLPDVSVVPFRAIIRYIYTGKLDLSEFSYKIVCEVFCVARKFNLNEVFINEIRGYLWENLVPDNVWTAIDFARDNREYRILDTAWKVVQLRADEILNQPSLFRDISESTLEKLLKRNYLEKTSEIQLFNTCVWWVQNVLNVEGREITKENMREKMSNFLHHIRFLVMPIKDFSESLATTILTKDEVSSIEVTKKTSNPQDLHQGISDKYVQRDECDITNVYVCAMSDTVWDGVEIGDTLPVSVSDIFTGDGLVDVEKKHLLLQVTLPTQLNHNGNNDKYDENLTIFVIQDNNREIIGKSKFVKRVKYNDYLNVQFEPPVRVKQNLASYSIIVKFHKDGTYPLNCAKTNEQIHCYKINKLGKYDYVCVFTYNTFEFIKQIYSKNEKRPK